jgi:hypothetical protein
MRFGRAAEDNKPLGCPAIGVQPAKCLNLARPEPDLKLRSLRCDRLRYRFLTCETVSNIDVVKYRPERLNEAEARFVE